jgi:tRNA (guanine6-N2)-methyltransferase
LEVWAPVADNWAMIAIRLSDRRMRHRTYKQEHLPASLRPTLAAAMVTLSEPRPGDRFCDPMCGVGTILAERALASPSKALIGGDIDPEAVRAAAANLSRLHRAEPAPELYLWDARRLPLRSGTIDVIVCNLPFGEQVGSHEENVALYSRFFDQLPRVLRPGGRAVLLTSEKELMRQLLGSNRQVGREREVLVGVLGQAARIYALRRY